MSNDKPGIPFAQAPQIIPKNMNLMFHTTSYSQSIATDAMLQATTLGILSKSPFVFGMLNHDKIPSIRLTILKFHSQIPEQWTSHGTIFSKAS
jgi:hypothetical protein